MIISFGKTWQALLLGQKTVTRRDWDDERIAEIRNCLRDNELVEAYTRDPEEGGSKIAILRITWLPESLTLPPFAYFAEGLHVLENGPELWRELQSKPPTTWTVIVFEVAWLTEYGFELRDKVMTDYIERELAQGSQRLAPSP